MAASSSFATKRAQNFRLATRDVSSRAVLFSWAIRSVMKRTTWPSSTSFLPPPPRWRPLRRPTSIRCCPVTAGRRRMATWLTFKLVWRAPKPGYYYPSTGGLRPGPSVGCPTPFAAWSWPFTAIPIRAGTGRRSSTGPPERAAGGQLNIGRAASSTLNSASFWSSMSTTSRCPALLPILARVGPPSGGHQNG